MNRHFFIAAAFSIITIMVVGMWKTYEVYMLVTIGSMAFLAYYGSIRGFYYFRRHRTPSKLKLRYLASIAIAWAVVTLLILLFEHLGYDKKINALQAEIEGPSNQIVSTSTPKEESFILAESMPMLTDRKLWSEGSGTHGFHYVCFNNRVIYFQYGGNKWTTYAPEYWHGIYATCENWPSIKKRMVRKTVKY